MCLVNASLFIALQMSPAANTSMSAIANGSLTLSPAMSPCIVGSMTTPSCASTEKEVLKSSKNQLITNTKSDALSGSSILWLAPRSVRFFFPRLFFAW